MRADRLAWVVGAALSRSTRDWRRIWGMWVSGEVIATLGVGATLLVATVAGFGWMIQYVDRRFARVDDQFARVDEKFARVDEKIDAQGESVREIITARVGAVERELVELKVAVARMEGPRPRFSTAR
ncbi:response regulator [Microbacterium lacticum]